MNIKIDNNLGAARIKRFNARFPKIRDKWATQTSRSFSDNVNINILDAYNTATLNMQSDAEHSITGVQYNEKEFDPASAIFAMYVRVAVEGIVSHIMDRAWARTESQLGNFVERDQNTMQMLAMITAIDVLGDRRKALVGYMNASFNAVVDDMLEQMKKDAEESSRRGGDKR